MKINLIFYRYNHCHFAFFDNNAIQAVKSEMHIYIGYKKLPNPTQQSYIWAVLGWVSLNRDFFDLLISVIEEGFYQNSPEKNKALFESQRLCNYDLLLRMDRFIDLHESHRRPFYES